MTREYHVVSFSGGKDSTAMLLKMTELGMPIDCILFCDTGLEFPAMYEHIKSVEKRIGKNITIVRANESFYLELSGRTVKIEREMTCYFLGLE